MVVYWTCLLKNQCFLEALQLCGLMHHGKNTIYFLGLLFISQMTGRYAEYAEELAKAVRHDFTPNIVKE